MTLKSMTGFGRSSGVHGETSWHWEVRSVNGRGLELRFRMPSGLEGLEIKARSLAQEMLARGNCTLNLTLRRESRRARHSPQRGCVEPGARRGEARARADATCRSGPRCSAWHAGRGRGGGRGGERGGACEARRRAAQGAWRRARPACRGADGGGRAAHDRHGQPAQPDREPGRARGQRFGASAGRHHAAPERADRAAHGV